MSRASWVRDTLISHGVSSEHADRVMAEVRAEDFRQAINALLRTTDGGELHDDAAIPAGEIRRILADLAASPGSTAGDEQPEDTLAAERDRLKAELGHLHRITLPNLRRETEWHQAGKKRWRDRAMSAEPRLDAVLDICDREQRNAMRWENPIPVPEWVAVVQRAALGDSAKEAK